MKLTNQIPLWLLIITSLIAIFLICIGVDYFLTGYVPASYRKHQRLPAMIGVKAILYGAFVILIGFLPLLLLAKNARQATIWSAVLGISLLLSVFIRIYAF
jgi:hypothetical protein